MRIATAMTAFVFMLAACGGGGSGGKPVSVTEPPAPPVTPPEPERMRPADTDRRIVFAPGADGHYRVDGLPEPLAADVRHMPVYRDDSRIQAGVDQTASRLRRLPVVETRGYFDIRYGRLNDGGGRAAVADYLEDAAGPTLRRYSAAPRVRVIGGAGARDANRVNAAVRLVNAALPEWAKMTVEAPLPHETSTDNFDEEGRITVQDGTPPNTVFVEFLPCAEFHDGCGTTYGGHAWALWRENTVFNSFIQMNNDASAADNDRDATILLAHELLHALGIVAFDHVDPSRFDSILEAGNGIFRTAQGIPQPLSLLYPVDREALQALYRALDPGDGPQGLGQWASTALHVAGQAEHAAFGVALRNGYAEPWAYGNLPTMALADNRRLSGLAAWYGALLGLTPDAAVVEGDAEIAVNLATMAGRADFTGLETWGANMPPGDRGTGATWLDGDLGYTIAVRGNTFRETGGDDGRLTGIFAGRSHEAAAGTLERSDLAAAFGASR